MISRRADYTFKFNRFLGRHGWLRLTPAYSVKLVEEIISSLPAGTTILDPFSGTATTGVAAGEAGYASAMLDVNPFLVWFGNAKLRTLTKEEAEVLRITSQEVASRAWEIPNTDLWYPEIKDIHRWWNKETLNNLAILRTALAETIPHPQESHVYTLLWIAFARVVMEHSAAAHNHVSMSFRNVTEPYSLHQINFSFLSFTETFIEDSLTPMRSGNRVFLQDSTDVTLLSELSTFAFDTIITSPPYPNRISYMRELRPYMFWLEFLNKASQAGELDWHTIGGTWGTATSRLMKWRPTRQCTMESLPPVVRAIRDSRNPNSKLLSIYVEKYFHDIDKHIMAIRGYLADNAQVHYVIGNSTFYGIHVPTPLLYEESLRNQGFRSIESRVIRKRNSKRELFEYCISARLRK